MAFYKGEPVFAWFGGEREGLPDSSIYLQYKDKVLSRGTQVGVAYWNPILFVIENELFLSYKMGHFCDDTHVRSQHLGHSCVGVDYVDVLFFDEVYDLRDGFENFGADLAFSLNVQIMALYPYIFKVGFHLTSA